MSGRSKNDFRNTLKSIKMIVNHLDHATIRPKLSFVHLHWPAMVVDLSIFVIPSLSIG